MARMWFSNDAGDLHILIIRDINAQGTTILLVEQNARMALAAHRGYKQTGL